MAIVYFVKHEEEFKLEYWLRGMVASFANCLGCFFLSAAFATGKAAGPLVAFLNTQSVVVIAVISFIDWKLPDFLQLVGVFIGILGALALTVPDCFTGLFRRCIKL